MSLVAAHGITKRYGGITALDRCSFAIERPGIYGLIGPNGAGKTTLFDAIAGDIPLDAGRIELDGADVTGVPSHALAARGLARSFQECRVFPAATCLENLRFTRQPKALGASLLQAFTRRASVDATSDAMRLLALVNLERYADEPAAVLSFGQRRLLEIVGTFMSGARVVLLDEPAAGVNPALIETLARAIRTMFADGGGVFLIVEHNMELIMSLASDIIVMHQGTVLERGTPEAIRASAKVAEAYLG